MARPHSLGDKKEEVIEFAKKMSAESASEGRSFLLSDFGAAVKKRFNVRFSSEGTMKTTLYRILMDNGITCGYRKQKLPVKKDS
jgi:hypothetical protein